MHILASLIQLPFHVVVATPWLVAAYGFHFLTRRLVSYKIRRACASGLAAVGLAPAYGAHLSMIPVYTLVATGSVDAWSALISIASTWCAIFAVWMAKDWLVKRRNRIHNRV